MTFLRGARALAVVSASLLGILSTPSRCSAAQAQLDSRATCEILLSWEPPEGHERAAGSATIEIRTAAEPAGIAVPPVRAAVRQAVSIRLAAGRLYLIRLVQPALWSEPLEFFARECRGEPRRFVFKPQPAGVVKGIISPEGPGASQKLDGPVVLRFSTSSSIPGSRGRDDFLEATSTCETALERRSFSCSLPAGRWDVAVKAPGYTSSRAWDIRLAEGATVDLGSRSVRRGGAISGWVERSDPQGPADGVDVRVDLRSVGPPSAVTRERQDASANRAKTDLRGFFAIQDLPSGSYVLEASFTGYSPVVLSGLEIAPGQEVQLREPILLAKPFDFEISLEPILDPSGSPWLVSVLARSARSGGLRETPAFQGEATDGVARVPVSVGDVLYIRVHNSARQRVRFVPGYTIADSSDRHLELEIDSIPVAGSVTVGDDPLRASLYFGGRSGAEMVELESDESGEFVGTLPKAGEWRVEVVAETAAISTWTSVSIPEKGTDDLEIELPRTRVSGTVVDAAGRPVPGAKVNLRTANASSAAKSQPAGEFDFRSFSAGPITLTARRSGPDGERSSAAVELSVAQDVAVEGVRLVLQENAPLRGRIVGPRGPVPGATLYVNVTHPLEFHNFGATGRTDELGAFEVELPAISSRAEVIVAAAGYALTAFEVDPRSEALLELPIDGGELVLRTSSTTPAAYGLVVYQDGLAISPALLDQWSQGQGAPPINPTAAIREMRVPHLAPGYYRSCVLDRAREMRRYVEEGAQTPDPIQCRDGFLHVGSILELDLTTN